MYRVKWQMLKDHQYWSKRFKRLHNARKFYDSLSEIDTQGLNFKEIQELKPGGAGFDYWIVVKGTTQGKFYFKKPAEAAS
jgi:hypothetical protein